MNKRTFMILVILQGIFFLGGMLYSRFLFDQVNNGFIVDSQGDRWQMTRLQTFGIMGDYFPVYRKE